MKKLSISLFLLLFISAGPTTHPAYIEKPPTRDGTGRWYMGREIAKYMSHLAADWYMSHLAADWLERPEREQEEAPRKLLDALQLKKTDVVADIGAGTGYFSIRIAPRVPDGKVLAEDIQPEMLEKLAAIAKERGVTNVQTVLGTETDPKLPEKSCDLVLLVDSYHEFDHPWEMMDAIRKGMKDDGRLVDVEYRGEDSYVPIKPLHKMTVKQATAEMKAAGFELVEVKEMLPRQHVMIFKKGK